MKMTQTESTDEIRSTTYIEDFFGSIWSLRSKVSSKSFDTVRKLISYKNSQRNIKFKKLVKRSALFFDGRSCTGWSHPSGIYCVARLSLSFESNFDMAQ